MAGEVKKVKKNVRSSSKVRNNSNLSSEELLEQIMNKKKAKKSNTNKNKISSDKKKVAVREVKDEKKILTDDELLESILNKKKEKSNKRTAVKKVSKSDVNESKAKDEVVENLEVINNEASDNKVNQHNDDLQNENTDSIEKVEKNEKADLENIAANDDLIITREIRFDDANLNLNNKKVLQELRKAIEDFDNLEDLEEINSSLDLINDKGGSKDKSSVPESVIVNKDNDDDYLIDSFASTNKKKVRIKYDNNERQKILLIIACLILISVLVFIIMHFVVRVDYSQSIKDSDEVFIDASLDDANDNKEEMKKIAYDDCMVRVKDVNDTNDKYMNAKNELTAYISENYKASVAYFDLTTGFDYAYEKNQYSSYYAASTTKTLAALYVYIKASRDEINLNTTMKYTSKYSYTASKGMKTHKYGEEISLKTLVKYAIIYSDNSAYRMLLDYVGRKELYDFYKKEYNLYTDFKVDDFGNISLEKGITYMTILNDFINNNGELGKELQSYFLNAEQNDVALPDLGIEAVHKYGQYSQYYHDIGIVYDEHPYIVVILTLEGGGNFEEKVKDISRHVYNLHKTFYENRQEICNNEVYGV